MRSRACSAASSSAARSAGKIAATRPPGRTARAAHATHSGSASAISWCASARSSSGGRRLPVSVRYGGLVATRSNVAAPRRSPTRAHVADDDLQALLPAVVVAAARGQRREPRLQLDADAGGGRIARQQQERQRARAAADVEEPSVRRGQEPFQQHRIQAHARAARRLVDADAARPQRVGGDVRVVGRPGGARRRPTCHRAVGPGRGAAPSSRYMHQAGRELGEEVRRLLRAARTPPRTPPAPARPWSRS